MYSSKRTGLLEALRKDVAEYRDSPVLEGGVDKNCKAKENSSERIVAMSPWPIGGSDARKAHRTDVAVTSDVKDGK